MASLFWDTVYNAFAVAFRAVINNFHLNVINAGVDVTLLYCTVSAVVEAATAEVSESSVDDVIRSEDRIFSQWRQRHADELSQLLKKVDELLLPLGVQTRLLVIERAG